MTGPTLRAALLASALCLPLAAQLPAFAAATDAVAATDTTMMAHAMPNAVFTLRTGIAEGKMVYIGKGGDIDGKTNPTLTAHEGDQGCRKRQAERGCKQSCPQCRSGQGSLLALNCSEAVRPGS